jgi:small multidrug resistance family-3 protein
VNGGGCRHRRNLDRAAAVDGQISPPTRETLAEVTEHLKPMQLATTAALFLATAFAEILGCYLPYLWLRQGKSAWLVVPAVACLAAFAWLLTFHPTAAGRTYAAYGGVYVSAALIWLWMVEGVAPTRWDLLGVGLCLAGMAVIMNAPRG